MLAISRNKTTDLNQEKIKWKDEHYFDSLAVASGSCNSANALKDNNKTWKHI